MKKIVLLSAFLSPYRSGAETMVEEVSRRLAGEFDITIVTGRYDRSLPVRDVLGGSVHIQRVGLGITIDKWFFPFLAAMRVRSLRPEIVHAVLESYAGLALVLCRWLYPRAKRMLTLQSTNTTLLLGAMHRSAQTITAISGALIERAKRFGSSDVRLIPNGIPFAMIQEACRYHDVIEGRILFVGRLEPMKGVDILLRAFALIQSRSREPWLPAASEAMHLRIVGDGSKRGALESLAQELGIADRVTFVGQVRPADVYDEYAQAAIFCGLSRSEALGNVFLEAQAGGCAIVATRVGGIPEIVRDGETGLLVAPDDPEEAAKAIARLMKDAKLRSKLSVAAIQHASQYDWEGISEKYRELYDELV